MDKLQEIEYKLENLINVEKKNWTTFYLLIKEVEEKKLWQSQYASFTQWVKDFSVRIKCHESTIWQKKKAGEVYNKYASLQKEKGIEVKKLEDAKVSAESLIVLEKIMKYDTGRTEELAEKVFNNKIKRTELREIYKAVRPKPEEEKFNKFEKIEETAASENIRSINVKTSDILSVLFETKNWLGEKEERKHFKSAFEQNKVEMFTEFPVFTGTTRKSRRIDLLCIENLTTTNLWELNIHGLEIKISSNDLLKDEKYTEYTEFIDYLWLVVPEELKDIALKNKFKGCGLIIIKQENSQQQGLKAEIVEKAVKLNAARREETLVSIALKLMR